MKKIISIFIFVLMVSTSVYAGDMTAKDYFERGLAYNDKGQHDKAIEDYNKAIELDLNYASAYYNRGVTYGSKGQYDKAIEDFSKVIELDPNDADAYYNRGVAYFNKEQDDKAIEDFNKAITLDPNNELAKDNLKRAIDEKNKSKNKGGRNEEDNFYSINSSI